MTKAKLPGGADKSAEKPRIGRPFEPGNNANPFGRPKGSRNKLGEAFIEALHEDFAKGGIKAIERVRTEDPAAYMRVVAGILPKEFKIETTSDLTDEQLDARILQLAAIIGIEIGTGGPAGRTPAEAEPEPAGGLSTLQ